MQGSSIDLRQYLFILRRYWIPATAVFLLVLAAGVAYCLFWPKEYSATTKIVIQPQKVPSQLVKATITSRIEERLQIITQQVLSSSRLKEIIDRFDLYPEAKEKLTPSEITDEMRKKVQIQITNRNYFAITFQYWDRDKVADVANALAAFYVDSNLRIREQDAVGTARFLDREKERLKQELEEKEAELTIFKQKHLHELPEAQNKNLFELQSLQTRFAETSRFQNTERQQIQNSEGLISYNTIRLQSLELAKAQARARSVATTGGDAVGETEPEAIKKEIERLKVFYKGTHPDIQRLQRHLEKAEEQKEAQKKAKENKEDDAGLEVAQIELEMGNLREQIRRAAERIVENKKRIEEYEKQKQEIRLLMKEVQARIDNGPAVAEALENLSRGFNVLKSSYEKTQSKWHDANMAANLERTQRGEQFEVVEPAQRPEQAYKPDVKKALPISFVGALALAVGIAFGFHFIDTSFTSVAMVERMTEFPVLVVVPPLLSRSEVALRRTRNFILLAIYGAIFFALLAMIYLLISGRDEAIKNLIMGFIK